MANSSNKKMSYPKDIKIKSVLGGWIVKIDFKVLVFTDQKTMLKELKRYLNDPGGTMARWRREAPNSRHEPKMRGLRHYVTTSSLGPANQQ